MTGCCVHRAGEEGPGREMGYDLHPSAADQTLLVNGRVDPASILFSND
jgi:hypothetical protein